MTPQHTLCANVKSFNGSKAEGKGVEVRLVDRHVAQLTFMQNVEVCDPNPNPSQQVTLIQTILDSVANPTCDSLPLTTIHSNLNHLHLETSLHLWILDALSFLILILS